MKTLIKILCLSVLWFSCFDNEIGSTECRPNCGQVQEAFSSGFNNFYLTIRNECTMNDTTISVDQMTYLDYVGENRTKCLSFIW